MMLGGPGFGWMILAGVDLMRGPPCWHFWIGWNDRQLLGHDVPHGELRHADHIEITWRWPLTGFAFYRLKMHWRI